MAANGHKFSRFDESIQGLKEKKKVTCIYQVLELLSHTT